MILCSNSVVESKIQPSFGDPKISSWKILWFFFTIAIFRIFFSFFRYIISYKCDIPQNKKFPDFLFFFEFFGTKCMWGSMKSVEFVVNSTHSSHIAWLWSIISSIHTRLSGFGAKKSFLLNFFYFGEYHLHWSCVIQKFTHKY